MKRYRARNPKPGELLVYYGKLPHDEPDVIYHAGDGVPRCDRALLHLVLGSKRPPMNAGDPWECSFIDELIKRGYDISTLRFSISKQPNYKSVSK